jgi:hypothetical protein
MKRFRVDMTAELQAESEEEAIGFLEAAYGDVEPDESRVLVLEVVGGEEIEVPEWVAKAASR